MTKFKKIFSIVLLCVLSLVTTANTVLLVVMVNTIRDMQANPYSYFPFMQPTGQYIKIDDVGFIGYDYNSVMPSAESIKNGGYKIYSDVEVREILDQAKSDAN